MRFSLTHSAIIYLLILKVSFGVVNVAHYLLFSSLLLLRHKLLKLIYLNNKNLQTRRNISSLVRKPTKLTPKSQHEVFVVFHRLRITYVHAFISRNRGRLITGVDTPRGWGRDENIFLLPPYCSLRCFVWYFPFDLLRQKSTELFYSHVCTHSELGVGCNKKNPAD